MEKVCRFCGKTLTRRSNEVKYQFSRRTFCDRHCSTSHNNTVAPKRKKVPKAEKTQRPKKDQKRCKACGKPLSGGGYHKSFCDLSCHNDLKHREWTSRWLAGQEDGMSGASGTSNHIYRWLKEGLGEKCQRCGWAEVNPYTGRVPVQLEHIDGNFRNNRPENLTLLCPSCHSLTPTYCGANKGHGRPYRYKSPVLG